MLKLLQNEINRKKAMRPPIVDEELLRLQRTIKNAIKSKYDSSLKLYIVDSGSCGACELELQTLFNPFYNLSKQGVEVVYTPKEADIMLITGTLTENMYESVEQAYRELKKPKKVITIGDCPLMESPLRKTFAMTDIKRVSFSSVYHIAGCPPEPRGIIKGLIKYIETV